MNEHLARFRADWFIRPDELHRYDSACWTDDQQHDEQEQLSLSAIALSALRQGAAHGLEGENLTDYVMGAVALPVQS